MPLPATTAPRLAASIRHALVNSGSLARPALVLGVGDAYGLPQSASEDLAVAMEYFHTASLLFDDLPAMDDAALRRGAPTTHVLHGEAHAMLAALAIINRAYALVWRAVASSQTPARQRALDFLETKLGVAGVLNGQSMDLTYSRHQHDAAIVEDIAIGKTVALIELALVLPALLASAPEEEVSTLERLALEWGLSYQSLDDLKDVLGSGDTITKTAANDQRLGRPNMAAAIGVPATIDRIHRLMERAQRSLAQLTFRRPALAFLRSLGDSLAIESQRLAATFALTEEEALRKGCA